MDRPNRLGAVRADGSWRAACQGQQKLISLDGEPDELFDITADPGETSNLLDSEPERTAALQGLLETMVAEVELRRPETWAREQLRIRADQALQERLRGLGYIE